MTKKRANGRQIDEILTARESVLGSVLVIGRPVTDDGDAHAWLWESRADYDAYMEACDEEEAPSPFLSWKLNPRTAEVLEDRADIVE